MRLVLNEYDLNYALGVLQHGVLSVTKNLILVLVVVEAFRTSRFGSAIL